MKEQYYQLKVFQPISSSKTLAVSVSDSAEILSVSSLEAQGQVTNFKAPHLQIWV